jgi:hypothetical protein
MSLVGDRIRNKTRLRRIARVFLSPFKIFVFFSSVANKLEHKRTVRMLENPVYPIYIITSKDIVVGNSKSDVPNPSRITEIASELIITRLYLISLLNSKVITKEAVIVCIAERKALYSNIFPNVIDFQTFKTLKIPRKQIVDLLGNELLDELGGDHPKVQKIPYFPFYQNYERDKIEIQNFAKSKLEYCDVSRPFVSFVLRKRGAWPEKNMTDQFWKEVISLFVEAQIPVFVFGKETEEFCEDPGVTHVKNFQDWCTLTTMPNLKHVGSTMTGGVYPVLIFGNSNTKMTLIDNKQLMALHGHKPIFYHSCINFAKVPISFINHIPTPREYFNEIRSSF